MLREVTGEVRRRRRWIANLVALVTVLSLLFFAACDESASVEERRDREAHGELRARDAAPSRAPAASRGPASRSPADAQVRETAKPRELDLPPEAYATLDAIARGGPFRHRQDGAVFQNRERHLPAQPRGYYREYTVETPGSRDRGPRRIVTGGDPPNEFFYTSDHYRSFRRIEVSR
ncbi:MAG: ribonuclease domain-containing protein [Kofleriaceae bacterium]|nr:ribonuclease domain-containing protein [Kofleriaceae bacterium]